MFACFYKMYYNKMEQNICFVLNKILQYLQNKFLLKTIYPGKYLKYIFLKLLTIIVEILENIKSSDKIIDI